MRLRLIVSTDPGLLLSTAAAGFFERQPASGETPFPSVPYLLALRQGGLRDDIIERAAELGNPGWFDPPLCVFDELPTVLGVPQPERPPLGEQDRLVLLGGILRAEPRGGAGVFARLARPDDFIGAVDALFAELIAGGAAPEQFARAIAARRDRDDFECRRDDELARAYGAYVAELARLRRADGRDQLLHTSRALESGAADLASALRGRREIRIFGLADLRRGWLPLLRALAASPALDEVAVYSSAALPLEPLGFVREEIGSRHAIAARLFPPDADAPDRRAPPADEGPPAAALVSAPDAEREHDEVARRVRALIAHGTAPHRIAIVARKARPHVDLAVAALARIGVPATARQRLTLAEIPVVRAVRRLLAASAAGWTRPALAEVARQPYFDCGLDARLIDAIGYRQAVTGLEAWERALRRLGPEAVEARERFSRFAMHVRPLGRRQTLARWLGWLGDFLVRDPLRIREGIRRLPAGRFDVVRRDVAGLTGLAAAVEEWRQAVEHFGAGEEEMDVAELAARLRDVTAGDVALRTPVQRGVQVLESLAAAYRSFDHVFIVGMEAGKFPGTAPRSPILDERERDALCDAGLALDRRSAWEERERELFRVLVAGARASLTLSFARLDESGREVIRSSFVEELRDVLRLNESSLPAAEVVVHGVPVCASAAGRVEALRVATIERDRASGAPSPYNGSVSDPELLEWLAREFGDDRRWSPTQLEELAKCPWAYMSRRLLRIERFEDPDEEIDPTTRGSILHAALRHFYDDARDRLDGPVFLRAEHASWAFGMLEQALDRALDEAADDEKLWLGRPSLRDVQRAELLRTLSAFLEWEIELHEEMVDPASRKQKAPKMVRTGVDEHELAFDDMVYEHDGVRIRYRGTIDRVEVSIDERAPGVPFIAAADYKTTKHATPGSGERRAWDDGVVLQVPLYAYALSRLRPGSAVARVEYLALRSRESVHQLQLYTIPKKGGEPESMTDAEDQWHAALRQAVAHVKRARGGEFPAAPPPTCGCPSWCHGRDICRVSPVHLKDGGGR